MVRPFCLSVAMLGMPGFRRAMEEESFASKKANGNVRWNSDREVAPQEGGRG